MVNNVCLALGIHAELQFLRRIVQFNRLRLDDDGSVATLVILTLVGDGPDYIATRGNYHACHDDGHN